MNAVVDSPESPRKRADWAVPPAVRQGLLEAYEIDAWPSAEAIRQLTRELSCDEQRAAIRFQKRRSRVSERIRPALAKEPSGWGGAQQSWTPSSVPTAPPNVSSLMVRSSRAIAPDAWTPASADAMPEVISPNQPPAAIHLPAVHWGPSTCFGRMTVPSTSASPVSNTLTKAQFTVPSEIECLLDCIDADEAQIALDAIAVGGPRGATTACEVRPDCTTTGNRRDSGLTTAVSLQNPTGAVSEADGASALAVSTTGLVRTREIVDRPACGSVPEHAWHNHLHQTYVVDPQLAATSARASQATINAVTTSPQYESSSADLATYHCGGSASDATALSAADTDRAAASNDGHQSVWSVSSREDRLARGTSLAEDLLTSLVSSLSCFASPVRSHPLPATSAYCTVAHADTRALLSLCPVYPC